MSEVLGLAVSSSGILYAADYGNCIIRAVNIATNIITTVVGTPTTCDFSGDGGVATSSKLCSPYGIWLSSNNDLYIADFCNYRIRRVSSNIINTIAGTGSNSLGEDGVTATTSALEGPVGVAGDSLGNIYIAERSGCRVRMVQSGLISTVLGTGTCGNAGSTYQLASSAPVSSVYQVWVNTMGTLYVVEDTNCIVRYVTLNYTTLHLTARPSNYPTISPSRLPTYSPSTSPSFPPTHQPVAIPTCVPSTLPSYTPSMSPSNRPSSQPSSQPTRVPSGQPSCQPTNHPTSQPSSRPSSQPSSKPSSQPSSRPSSQPSDQPSSQPSGQPSVQPSCQPTSPPSSQPSRQPLGEPSSRPSGQTFKPTGQPSCYPSGQPSSRPSTLPSSNPSLQPSSRPSSQPSSQPSPQPSVVPSSLPSSQPTAKPSDEPTSVPTRLPTILPSTQPSAQPSMTPSGHPTSSPTSLPTQSPSTNPSSLPSSIPSNQPTNIPSSQPSSFPSTQPSSSPSLRPSNEPSSLPSCDPTSRPTISPSAQPSSRPSSSPTQQPSTKPSTIPTSQPSNLPTNQPSCRPSSSSSIEPTSYPSSQPSSNPSRQPSTQPSNQPTSQPSIQPSSSPTRQPIANPSSQPSSSPSRQPSNQPTSQPSGRPSAQPSSQPTSQPSTQPSRQPSSQPSSRPSSNPSSVPTRGASGGPTSRPTLTSSNFNRVFSLSPLNVTAGGGTRMGFKEVLFPYGVMLRQAKATSPITEPLTTVGSNYVVYGGRGLLSVAGGSLNVQNLLSGQRGLVRSVGEGVGLDVTTRSAVLAGDVNGDSFSDLLLGDPLSSLVYVFYGRGTRTSQFLQGYYIYGESSSDYLGWAVAGAGDFNGDGYGDMVMSAIGRNRCYMIYGGSSRSRSLYLSKLKASEGMVIGVGMSGISSLGVSLSGAGDVNHDGYKDVMLTGMGSSGANMIFVLFGGNQTSSSLSLTSSLSQRLGCVIQTPMLSFAGLSLSSLGDVSGDGVDDVVIGSMPYSGGYNVQQSYVIFGSSSRSSFCGVSLSNLTIADGVTIVGGGIVVAGPGDVNEDGVNDVLVTNYLGWQGKSASLLLSYPSRQTSSPSPPPTSYPTMMTTPSCLPSSQPSWGMYEDVSSPRPSRAPSFAPTGPTMIPSFRPTLNQSQPSNLPSSMPSMASAVPTILISRRPSIQRTARPSQIPTLRPSRPPTLSPTLSQLPSIPPTIQKTARPSRMPTQNPSVRPSITPSIAPSLAPNTVTSIVPVNEVKGTFTGENTNEQFIINPTENTSYVSGSGGATVLTMTGKRGAKTYTIYPAANFTLIITDFDKNNSVIDLSHFASGLSLSYSTDPLTMLLPDGQKIVLSSHRRYDLSSSNVIMPDSSSPSSSGSGSSSVLSSLSPSTLEIIFVLGGLFFFTFIAANREIITDTIFAEKKKLKKKTLIVSEKKSEANESLSSLKLSKRRSGMKNSSLSRVRAAKSRFRLSSVQEGHADEDNDSSSLGDDSDDADVREESWKDSLTDLFQNDDEKHEDEASSNELIDDSYLLTSSDDDHDAASDHILDQHSLEILHDLEMGFASSFIVRSNQGVSATADLSSSSDEIEDESVDDTNRIESIHDNDRSVTTRHTHPSSYSHTSSSLHTISDNDDYIIPPPPPFSTPVASGPHLNKSRQGNDQQEIVHLNIKNLHVLRKNMDTVAHPGAMTSLLDQSIWSSASSSNEEAEDNR